MNAKYLTNETKLHQPLPIQSYAEAWSNTIPYRGLRRRALTFALTNLEEVFRFLLNNYRLLESFPSTCTDCRGTK